MGKTVQVKFGFTDVLLPESPIYGTRYQAGQSATITDAEYSSLSVAVIRAITVTATGLSDPIRTSPSLPPSLTDAISKKYADATYATISGDGAEVTSFLTRTGAVVAMAGDYTASQVGADVAGAAAAAIASSVQRASNLSDLTSFAAARTNMGLGSASVQNSSAFDISGAATTAQAAAIAVSVQRASNLSDLASAATARTNLGLGTAATQASGAFDSSGAAASAIASSAQRAANLSDLASVTTARTNLGLGTAATQASGAFDAVGAASTAQTAAAAYSDAGLLSAAGAFRAPLIAFQYYGAVTNAITTLALANSTASGGRLVVGRSCTLTTIGVEVVTVGVSGSLIRLGIYKINPATGALIFLLDAGTGDGTILGMISLSISQPVSAGDNLILVACQQGSPVTLAVLRSNSGQDPYFGSSAPMTISQNALIGATLAGSVPGALPTSALTYTGATSVPRVLVSAAA
jgi:hypothetical protein